MEGDHQFVHGGVPPRGQPPTVLDDRTVEQADHGIGVSDVDGQAKIGGSLTHCGRFP
jgi:hypothetical protein